MTAKERVIQVLQGMPEDATLDEILERLQDLEDESAREVGTGSEEAIPEGGVWALLRGAAGAVEMPTDWAAEHDHYLYGTPKRSSTA